MHNEITQPGFSATLFIVLPLLGMLLTWLIGNRSTVKWIAFGFSLIQLGFTLYSLSEFRPDGGVQFEARSLWMEQFNVYYHVGIDGISMLMVLLTNLLLPLILLSSFRMEYPRPKLFYSMALLMQSALIGVFVSYDLFLYYIFWELALIPIYIIVLTYGGTNRVKATFKFFIYTLVGSLLMLVGIIYRKMTGDNMAALTDLERHLVFWGFFLAFAIKMPIFPLHTWQPDTYTTAPPQGTMLLSGIMLKMGIYSVIRWLLPIFPDLMGSDVYGKLLMGLSVTGIVYGSWIAITQKNIKRLFAYSSLGHVGLIAAGIFTMTLGGLQGSMVQMLAHGINIVGLFFVAQIIYDRAKTHNLPELGGIINQAPVFSAFFLIVLLGSVALPLTNGFVGEFMLLNAVFQFSPWLSLAAGTTVIFSAVYMLRAYQRSMLGELNPAIEKFEDLRPGELAVMLTLAVLVVALGVYPKPILDLTEPALRDLLNTAATINPSLK